MAHTLARFALSILLGAALAFSMVAATQLVNVPVANAQATTTTAPDPVIPDDDNVLTQDDFLSSEFAGATGLGQANLEKTIGNVINVVLGFLGIVAVVIVLWGGFKWMTAGGSEEKVTDAKKLLIAGVIGLAIILSAYAITSFVLSSLLEASS